jgi:hypothetical protein
MTKKQLLLGVTLFYLVLLLPFLALYVWKNRPLVPTWQWQAKVVSVSGEHIPVKTYKMLWQKMPVILYIEDGVMLYPPPYPISEGKLYNPQKWFAVSISGEKVRVFIPSPLPDLSPPYLRSSGNMGSGWDIIRGEFENIWSLSRDGDTVVFSNAVISVSVSKKD